MEGKLGLQGPFRLVIAYKGKSSGQIYEGLSETQCFGTISLPKWMLGQ